MLVSLSDLFRAAGINTCFSPRHTAGLVAAVTLVLTAVDKYVNPPLCMTPCNIRSELSHFTRYMVTLFQLANIGLLAAAALDNILLINLYIWFTLSFILFGFVAVILEFVVNYEVAGICQLMVLVPQVGLLFALSECLPLVESYRKCLEINMKNK